MIRLAFDIDHQVINEACFASEPGGPPPRSGVGDDPARKNWFIICVNLNKREFDGWGHSSFR
jgi:hypothetical protein